MASKVKSSERNNQLTNPAGYNPERIVFSDPAKGSVPDTPIEYYRINISTLNKDGSIGDLILPTERVFSFGVSENMNPETKKPNGWVLPLCLWNKEGPSQAEKTWTETFDKIVEHCKRHVVDVRGQLGQHDLEIRDLKKFNPIYIKKDKATGKVVDGAGPTLYAKLISTSGKPKKGKKETKADDGDGHGKILSMFFNLDDEPIDPLTLLGKYCYAKAAIKIESIFVGSKISLQVKLYEATIETVDQGMKPLLARPKPKADGRMLTGPGTLNDIPDDDDDANADVDDDVKVEAPKPVSPPEDDDAGSLPNSDTEEEPVRTAKKASPKKTEKATEKPAVKKVKKVVRKQ